MMKREELTPNELTAHLDRYIIVQDNAKRAAAEHHHRESAPAAARHAPQR